jgi:histidinol-phosphatase
MPWKKELEVALEAARRAGDLARAYQIQGVSADTKADDSPVTVADRESEKLLSTMLTEAFPDDGLLGEEGANRESRSGRRWILDPIDGTRDFLRGNPYWAVLIGLEIVAEARVTVGVAHLPALGVTYWATRGGGAFCNDKRLQASRITEVSQSVLCFNQLQKLSRFQGAQEWLKGFWAVRCSGGIPDAMMVAAGQAEIWVEPEAKPWDLAPIQVITEEAGACFFNFQGGASIHGGNCITCAPGMEAEARRFLDTAQFV